MIDRLHGGAVGGDIMDFSANINPLGLSPYLKKVIIKNISKVAAYPEADSAFLKKAIANFHNVRQTALAVGNGSIELIYLIPRALKIRKVLIITPTFSEYEFSSLSNGARTAFFKTEEKEGFRINPDKLKAHLSRADLIFLGNPNNPTGQRVPADLLSSLVKLCIRYKTILAIDEAFMDFIGRHDEGRLIRNASVRRGLLVLRSLTKFFAIPGLRLGYVIGDDALVKRISNLQYPWNINSLAQAAGEALLKDRDYMDKTRRYIMREREYLFDNLRNIRGLTVFPSDSNFMLCKLRGRAAGSAKMLNEALIKKGMVVRDCSNFRGLNEKFFRTAVRKRAENISLIAAIKEILLK